MVLFDRIVHRLLHAKWSYGDKSAYEESHCFDACRVVDVTNVVAIVYLFFFFFQAEDGIRDKLVTGVQTCALPICRLITLLDRLGERAGAVEAYEEFTKRLAADLETEPAAETKALMTAVRGRNLAAPVELPSRAAAGVGDVAGAAPALSPRGLWPAALGAGLLGLPLAGHASGLPSRAAAGVGDVAGAAPALSRRVLWPAALGAGLVGLLLAVNAGGWRGRVWPRPLPRRALAVLPLENLSGDSLQGWFADGMTEALITDLGRITALRVSSRGAVMQFRRTVRPLRDVVRDLHVDAVIEGGVQRSGDTVRVDLRLIDAASGYQLWAGRLEESVRDRFAIEDSAARSVAAALSSIANRSRTDSS